MVDEVLVERVALLGRAGRGHALVVLHERGLELVGDGVEEPVVALESAAERPLVVRPDRGDLVGRGDVPFADRERAVTGIAQDLRERARVDRNRAALARKTAVGVRDDRHADRVVVAPGEQRSAGGRAQRRRVEARVREAARREGVHVRRLDLAAVAAEAAEAHVVEHDDDDVRAAGRRPARRRPPRGRLLPGAADLPLELGLRRGAETGCGGLACFVAHLRSAFAASRMGSPALMALARSGTLSYEPPATNTSAVARSVFSVVPLRMSASASSSVWKSRCDSV